MFSIGNVYNIPVCLWLLDTYPYNPPICFVKPTSAMMIKTGKHIDANGKIYLPYLHEWKHVSNTCPINRLEWCGINITTCRYAFLVVISPLHCHIASVRPVWADPGDDCCVWGRTSCVFSTYHTSSVPSFPSHWTSQS